MGSFGPDPFGHNRTICQNQIGSFGPDPFGHNRTISQNQMGSGMALHNKIRSACARVQPSVKVGNWQRAGCVLPEPGPASLAHRLASGLDTFGQNLIRPTRSDSRRFCTMRSAPSLEEQKRTGCVESHQSAIHTTRSDSGCTLAVVMAITGRSNGHNWP